MPEPSIERIKTECYFIDMNGLEWQVTDARRRYDGKLWAQYPGMEDASLRYFVRYTPRDGAKERKATEVRRYRFTHGESRWFDAKAWQRQLNVSEIVSRVGDGK